MIKVTNRVKIHQTFSLLALLFGRESLGVEGSEGKVLLAILFCRILAKFGKLVDQVYETKYEIK